MSDISDDSLAELRGALRLAGAGIDAAASVTQDMHRAISAKPFGLLAQVPAGQVARRVHDGVRDGVYACVRGVSRGAPCRARSSACSRVSSAITSRAPATRSPPTCSCASAPAPPSRSA